MAYKEIEHWARLLQESIDEDKAYGKACENAMQEIENDIDEADAVFDDEVIDPASLGFIDDSNDVAENDMLRGRHHNAHIPESDEEIDDDIDLEECGFTEDGNEISEDEFNEYMNEDFHKDTDTASMTLEVDEDHPGEFGKQIAAEVPGVLAKQAGNRGGVALYKLAGTVADLKNAYVFYLGAYDWSDVESLGEDVLFDRLLEFGDGDTLEEADYREQLGHMFDDFGVKASTANLKKNNCCQLSVVKEAVKAELQKRKMMKALFEADVEDLSDEDLEKIEDQLDAGEAVDNDEATAAQERAWLVVLKQMGIKSIDEYKAMDPKEFQKRFEKFNQPLDSANGFARSKEVFTAYHRPDDEQGGATQTKFAFNPDYSHRVTRAEQRRKDKAARIKARDSKKIEFPKRKQDTWSLAEFGKLISSLGPKRTKELQKTMLQIVHDDNAGDPQAEAYETMFIKRLFGQKNPTFRDIAKAWYPGQDPNKRQQCVNRFFLDTEAMFAVATREATNSQNGGMANFQKNVLGNEANFQKFLKIMKDLSDKRANNQRSIINLEKRGAKKKPENKDA